MGQVHYGIWELGQTTTKDNKVQTHVHNFWDEWFPPHETCITSHPLLQISQFNYEKCKKKLYQWLNAKKDETPVHLQWSYVSFALSRWYIVMVYP